MDAEKSEVWSQHWEGFLAAAKHGMEQGAVLQVDQIYFRNVSDADSKKLRSLFTCRCQAVDCLFPPFMDEESSPEQQCSGVFKQ